MAKKLVAELIRGKAAQQPPDSFCRQIGLIVCRWAFAEHQIQQVIWEAANVDDPTGRIAIREPRLTERLVMLDDLVGLRGATWDVDLYKRVYSECERLKSRRDLVAHGLWHAQKRAWNTEWMVQVTRATWPKDPNHPVSSTRKSIIPESRIVTLNDLRRDAHDIHTLIQSIDQLKKSAVFDKP